MWENAYFSIKNPKASRALKRVLDNGHTLFASLTRLRFTTLVTLGLRSCPPWPNPGSAPVLGIHIQLLMWIIYKQLATKQILIQSLNFIRVRMMPLIIIYNLLSKLSNTKMPISLSLCVSKKLELISRLCQLTVYIAVYMLRCFLVVCLLCTVLTQCWHTAHFNHKRCTWNRAQSFQVSSLTCTATCGNFHIQYVTGWSYMVTHVTDKIWLNDTEYILT